MNNLKQRAKAWLDKLDDLGGSTCAIEQEAYTLLQELIDAPEVLPATNPSQISSSAEPFGYFKAEPFGWTDCAETDDGAIALYTAPPVSDVEPVAYVTGVYGGHTTVAPIDAAQVLRVGMALYTAPPEPPADVTLDAERLDFVTEGAWHVQWEKKRGDPKRYRMAHDGEPWGKWHKSARAAIDAAIERQGGE